MRVRKSAGVAERAIGDDRDAVLFAPWGHAMLDRALTQVIQHLVASRLGRPRNPADLVEIVHVEIADAPRQNLAVCVEPLEGGDRVRERMRPAPMQKIAIEAVSLEPLKRTLARGDRPIPRRVVRQDFGDEEDLAAPAGDRGADHFLGRARPVHLRRIDMRHAEVEASAQSRDRRLTIRLLDIPCALADDRDIATCGAEWPPLHGSGGALYAVRRHGAACWRP